MNGGYGKASKDDNTSFLLIHFTPQSVTDRQGITILVLGVMNTDDIDQDLPGTAVRAAAIQKILMLRVVIIANGSAKIDIAIDAMRERGIVIEDIQDEIGGMTLRGLRGATGSFSMIEESRENVTVTRPEAVERWAAVVDEKGRRVHLHRRRSEESRRQI